MAAGESDRPRGLHALQCVRAGLSGRARSTSSYQVDLDKCKSHRACVKACGAIGAIDFSRADTARKESFDIVLDLSRQPLIRIGELPQGYLAPGDDPLEQALAARKLGYAGRRVREAQVLRLQRAHLRP